jgi:Zn finger protein HypA/HybF involved in hydrogenase expression
MIAEIGAGFSSLKAALDLAKGLNAANTQTAINEIKIELQEHILGGQQALGAAREVSTADAERIRQLEQQIVQFKDWEGEKRRYELKAVAGGAFAYVLKAGMENSEPTHWACTNCFENRRKSILQKMPSSTAQAQLRIPTQYECPACKAKIAL